MPGGYHLLKSSGLSSTCMATTQAAERIPAFQQQTASLTLNSCLLLQTLNPGTLKHFLHGSSAAIYLASMVTRDPFVTPKPVLVGIVFWHLAGGTDLSAMIHQKRKALLISDPPVHRVKLICLSVDGRWKEMIAECIKNKKVWYLTCLCPSMFIVPQRGYHAPALQHLMCVKYVPMSSYFDSCCSPDVILDIMFIGVDVD